MKSEVVKNAAILIPTYDELSTTIGLSLLNIGLRLKEANSLEWAVLVGVNGTDSEEEVAKVKRLIYSIRKVFEGVHVEVHHYTQKGKENAMNQLAAAAVTFFGADPDINVGTDVKVYRKPSSIAGLVSEFSQSNTTNPDADNFLKYLGGSVLPYPISDYERYFPLSVEQRLFYTLLEIDKDPQVLEVFPKDHIRGGLYATGKWDDLIIGVPDDFTLTRRARLLYGKESVRIHPKSVGYVIPRQSFADYFSVRFNRAMKHENELEKTHPQLAGPKEKAIDQNEYNQKLATLKEINPQKHALFVTKKLLDAYAREIITAMHAVEGAPTRKSAAMEIITRLESEIGASAHSVATGEMNLDFISSLALEDPEVAAKYIIVYYQAIILALAVDPNSVPYGSREERFRGMLPLDTEEAE